MKTSESERHCAKVQRRCIPLTAAATRQCDTMQQPRPNLPTRCDTRPLAVQTRSAFPLAFKAACFGLAGLGGIGTSGFTIVQKSKW